MSKRKAIERATDVRNAMIGGLWANTNLDDGKDTRTRLLREIQDNYDDTIKEIYVGKRDEIDLKEHPFFAAMKVPGEELMNPEPEPVSTDRTSETQEFDTDQT